MRQEYVDAVNAARWGWSLWLGFALPAGLIWHSAQRRKAGCLAFVVACAACWFLVVCHANHIQATKFKLAETDEEFDDMANDMWNTFAPVSAVPYTLVYCTLHAALARGAYSVGRRLAIRSRRAAQKAPDH